MKRYIFFSAFVILLVSCEYKLEETNFREKEPPSEYAYMEINLNDINPLDTIYIWAPTRFTCSVNSGQLQIHKIDITINGSSVELKVQSQSNISFNLYPEYYGNGNHKLKVDCITSSGTRSLADLLGYEGYQFEAIWNIKVINLSDGFKSGYRILENGQVELYWDNPFLPDVLIEGYRVNGIGLYSSDLYHQKSIIINDYVCGKSIYNIETFIVYYIYGDTGPKYLRYGAEILIDTPIPKVYIEDLDLNKLRIYWDKPAVANAKYTVNYPRFINNDSYYTSKISDISDTTVIVSKPPVGGHFKCTVDFYPNKPYHTWPYASSNASFLYGEKVGFNTYHSWYEYNMAENIVYIVEGDSIAVIDAHTLDSRHTELEIQRISYITSQNSSKFAIIGYDKIYIYENSKLINPTIFPIFHNQPFSYIFMNEFLFEYNNSGSNIYDLITGSIISTQPVLGNWVEMSADGQYFACRNMENYNTIDIYKFSIENFTTIATHTGPHTLGLNQYYFHPNRPDQIIIEWDNPPNYRTIDLYQLPQFEKLQSTNLPWGTRIINIDPITELVVYSKSNFDPNYSGISGIVIAPLSDLNNELYTSPGNCFIYNGCLFSSNGYAVDIKKELLQP